MEGKKLISATDTQYSGTLLKSLNEQRALGLFCDVTIIVEDRKFRAHKNVLCASSTYFHQLFSVAGQVIELNFLRADIFAEILNYIYSSKLVRVRSDLLEELIKSGQTLGVKFIAELGVPLSQVKGISGGAKDVVSETLPSSSDPKGLESQKSTTNPSTKNVVAKEEGPGMMPIITEAFSISSEEFSDSKKSKSSKDEEEDDDDDVIFCSEILPPQNNAAAANNSNTATQTQVGPSSVGSNQKSPAVNSSLTTQTQTTTSVQKISTNNGLLAPAQTQAKSDISTCTSAQKHLSPNTIVAIQSMLSSQQSNSSSIISSAPQKNLPPSINVVVHKQHISNSSLNQAQTSSVNSSPSTSASAGSSSPQQSTSQKAGTTDGSGVQKKKVITFTQEPTAKPGEFKIKISDVFTGNAKNSPTASGPKHIMDGKKIITLDKDTEIDALSTGCKVYANIGENTYDIVIPIKEDPDEGESKGNNEASINDSPNRKRMKLKHDDHYELIVDGRVYYICIVCKRSYVCLTSLRRHFNVHSWERKYPCHYCEKVFPLAEYRTKHEIHHTGERRYQCLTCGKCFINYQVMASHIRSVHSQDPSGDSKLYRLHPCKSLQIRQYAYITDPSNSIPIINEDGLVYHVDPGKEVTATQEQGEDSPDKQMTWDDIFPQPGNQPVYRNTPEGHSEFEFVIPESY
uniref:Transcriptional regulator Kaiso n=1 Tax=Latimeria chalumnae TaxID=7897 RepID=H3AHL4_LATCH